MASTITETSSGAYHCCSSTESGNSSMPPTSSGASLSRAQRHHAHLARAQRRHAAPLRCQRCQGAAARRRRRRRAAARHRRHRRVAAGHRSRPGALTRQQRRRGDLVRLQRRRRRCTPPDFNDVVADVLLQLVVVKLRQSDGPDLLTMDEIEWLLYRHSIMFLRKQSRLDDRRNYRSKI
jgi:hypothetical protein